MKLKLMFNEATKKWEVLNGKNVIIVSRDKALLKEWCKESGVKV